MLHLLSIVFLFFNLSYSDNCSSIKSGTFKTENLRDGQEPIVTIIERKGNIQIERCEQLGVAYKFRIDWVNECTYTLTWLETIKDESNFGYPEGMVLTIEVLEVKPGYYIQSATSNLFEDKIEGKVEIIK